MQLTKVLPACTMQEQNFSFCANFWSEKIKMERLGHLQAISHTWLRIEPNELADLEWAEQSYLSDGSRLSSLPGG